MKKWLIEWLGGYPDFMSAIKALKKSDDVPAKNALLTEAVKHLFNAIDANDILHKEKGQHVFMGRVLTESEYTSLCSEAQNLVGMRIWRVLKMDIRYQLNKKMFEESNITVDVMWGKLVLYLDDIIRTRLQKMK